jgi:Uma2 family endonuclease
MGINFIYDKLDTCKKYNASDYFNLPEGSPYQLVNGELIMSPSPSSYHQIVSWNFGFIISDYVRKHNLGIVFYAPIDVYFDDNNVYQPDIIFISNENKSIIKEKGILGVPDLVIEILSPSTAYYDIKTKKELYDKSGVKEYIIVDPVLKTVDTFIKNNKELNSSLSLNKDNKIFINTLKLDVELKEIFKIE